MKKGGVRNHREPCNARALQAVTSLCLSTLHVSPSTKLFHHCSLPHPSFYQRDSETRLGNPGIFRGTYVTGQRRPKEVNLVLPLPLTISETPPKSFLADSQTIAKRNKEKS